MKNKTADILRIILIILLAIFIPGLLTLYAFQSQRYTKLYNDVVRLEKKQEMLIEQNNKLISDISLVSNSDEIERKATEELNMHKAEKEDIVRVEISSK